MTSAIPETYSTMNNSFVKMFDWNRSVLEKVMRSTHQESIRFINHRLEQNKRALESMRDASGMAGLMAAEHEWLAGTARDYLEQGEKVGNLLAELAASGAKEVADEGRATTEKISAAVKRDVERTRQHMQQVDAAHRTAAE